MIEKKKYRSPFMRIPVTPQGGKNIQELQREFDQFWRRVHKYADTSHEKFYAQKAMQEACQWMCRCVAMRHEADTETNAQTSEVDVKKILSRDFSNLKDGDVIKNNPRIVVKKKRSL
jgi:hypothetical protein